MDEWGSKMLATVSTVAEVVAAGLGLPADAFTSRMHLGPHLLAPTGAQPTRTLTTCPYSCWRECTGIASYCYRGEGAVYA